MLTVKVLIVRSLWSTSALAVTSRAASISLSNWRHLDSLLAVGHKIRDALMVSFGMLPVVLGGPGHCGVCPGLDPPPSHQVPYRVLGLHIVSLFIYSSPSWSSEFLDLLDFCRPCHICRLHSLSIVHLQGSFPGKVYPLLNQFGRQDQKTTYFQVTHIYKPFVHTETENTGVNIRFTSS